MNNTQLKVIDKETFDIQRKMLAAMTTQSWEEIPHVGYTYEPEVTKLFEEYKRINKNRTGENKITFNTLMLKIIAE